MVERQSAPDNPVCPICGAVDWFAFVGLRLLLQVMPTGADQAWIGPTNEPWVLPVAAFACRSCRFLRLRVTEGTLDWNDAEDLFKRLSEKT